MPVLSRSASSEPGGRRAEVEAALLAATERLLGAGAPFADLTVEQIAREAGVSRTAFYFHFRDKRDLLMRATSATADELWSQAEAWLTGRGDAARDLRDALRGVADLYVAHGPLIRAVVEASAYDEPTGELWRALVGRFVAATRERLDAERPEGVGASAELVAASLVWMTERTLYQYVARPGAPAAGAVDDLVAALEAIWGATILD